MSKTPNYTLIHHETRIELGLSMNEYAVAELIYNLSSDPSSDYPGWCFASKKRIGHYLGLSEQSIHTILNKLFTLKLLDKHPETKHLKVTSTWYDKVVTTNTKESLAILKKQESGTKDSLVGTVKEREEKESNKEREEREISQHDKDNLQATTNVVGPEAMSGEVVEYGNTQVTALCNVFKQAFGHLPNEKQQRRSASSLIRSKTIGFDKAMKAAEYALSIQHDRYAPKVCSPHDLYQKYSDLVVYYKKHGPNLPTAMKASDIAKLKRGEQINVT